MQDPVTQRFTEVYETLKNKGKVGSQKEFADLMEFPEQYFSGYRSGSRKVSPKVLNRLAIFYGVSLNYLMSGQGEMFTQQATNAQHNQVVGNIGNLAGRNIHQTQTGSSDCEQQLQAALIRISDLEARLKDKDELIALLRSK